MAAESSAVPSQPVADETKADEVSSTKSNGLDEERQAVSPENEKDEAAKQPPAASAGPPGGPQPNGGLQAWLQVLGSFMLFFNTWGILNTFGVYQTYYESGQLFHESSSNISWIGSVQALMVLLVGVVSGPIYDRGHLRLLLLVGTFGVVFGHMMLSLCHTFWQVILAQGFVIGIGGGCLFIPAVAILPTYFSSRIGLAIGLAASGSSMGGIIYPIMFYRLLGAEQLSFGWSVRILGFTALATLIIPITVMKMRVKPGKVRTMIDMTAFTDVPYMTFVVGSFIGFIGLYVGLFYISFYGQQTGITDASLSFYLVPILNVGSVFGRTLPNWLSDKIGPLNVICPGAFLVGTVLLCNIAVHNAGGLIVNTLFFGFFSGVFIALPPVLFVALTKDKSKIGSRIGMGFAMLGAGVLAGGPGAGGILGKPENPHPNWTGVWTYGGVTAIAAGVIFCGLRIMKAGFKITKI